MTDKQDLMLEFLLFLNKSPSFFLIMSLHHITHFIIFTIYLLILLNRQFAGIHLVI